MLYPTLPRSEVKMLIDAGAQLVDVRSPHQYQQHALPGSVNIPLAVIQRAHKLLDKETPVLLYCASGQRCSAAKRVLEACGFSRVHIIGPHSFLHNCD